MKLRGAAFAVVLGLVGCATRPQPQPPAASAGTPPPPVKVAVFEFAVTPDQVTLDQGVRAEFLRAGSGEPMSALQMQAAQAAQAELAEALAAKLQSYGLRAVHELPGSVPPPGTLEVQGQILSINEGNKTRRRLIGLGAGKSSMSADAQLFYVTDPARPQFLQTFNSSANSGHMPGAAETMGAGAAAQRLAESGATTAATQAGAERRTTDTANADRVAASLASQIAQYAVRQGWLAASAAQ